MAVRKKNKRKKAKGGIWLLLAILAFVMSLGFFFASHKNQGTGIQTSLTEKITQLLPKVKDVVSGDSSADLREKSRAAQRAVDEILMQQKKWQLSDDGRKEMQAETADGTGQVQWVQRKLLIGIPEGDSLRQASDWLQEQLETKGLVVTKDNVVEYLDDKAVAIGVALAYKANKQTQNFVTDEIIIFNGDQTAEKSKEIAKEEAKKEAKQSGKAKRFKGKLAVIVDDCGYDLGPVKALSRLPVDMAFAILPFKGNSTEALNIVLANNQIAMLHLPMEPQDGESSENRTIKVGMTRDDIQKLTRDAISSLPGIKGVNNHQGSKATANEPTMRAVLNVVKDRDLFFVDSNTSGTSMGDKLAGRMGISTGRNQHFLDNSSEVSEIKKQIWVAAELANRNGSALVICHARPATATAWEECYKELQASGITLVPVTTLLI